jgi:hypothetical protein
MPEPDRTHDTTQLLALLDAAGDTADWADQMSRHFVDAPGGQYFAPKLTAYRLARVRYFATRRPLDHRDYGGCIGCTHTPRHGGSGYDWELNPDCAYHLAASLQPWNHRNPWACGTYYDGCNCEGGPYYEWPADVPVATSTAPA